MIDLKETFDKFSDEYIKFQNIGQRLHHRPDICAFLILDKLIPDEKDMVSAAEHDEIYLDTNIERLAEVATEEDIADLIRCGVRLCDEYDCLCMFV